MRINSSSLLDMSRVTNKHMEVGKCKTYPHPAPLPCLLRLKMNVTLAIKISFGANLLSYFQLYFLINSVYYFQNITPIVSK